MQRAIKLSKNNIRNDVNLSYFVSDMILLMKDEKFVNQFSDDGKQRFIDSLNASKEKYSKLINGNEINNGNKINIMKKAKINTQTISLSEGEKQSIITAMFDYENTIFAWLRRFINWYFSKGGLKNHNEETRSTALYLIMGRIYYLIDKQCVKKQKLNKSYNIVLGRIDNKYGYNALMCLLFELDCGSDVGGACDNCGIDVNKNELFETKKENQDDMKTLYLNFMYKINKQKYDDKHTPNENNMGIKYDIIGSTLSFIGAILKSLLVETYSIDNSCYKSHIIDNSLFFSHNDLDNGLDKLKNTTKRKYTFIKEILSDVDSNDDMLINIPVLDTISSMMYSQKKYIDLVKSNVINYTKNKTNTACAIKIKQKMDPVEKPTYDNNFYALLMCMCIVNNAILYICIHDKSSHSKISKYAIEILSKICFGHDDLEEIKKMSESVKKHISTKFNDWQYGWKIKDKINVVSDSDTDITKMCQEQICLLYISCVTNTIKNLEKMTHICENNKNKQAIYDEDIYSMVDNINNNNDILCNIFGINIGHSDNEILKVCNILKNTYINTIEDFHKAYDSYVKNATEKKNIDGLLEMYNINIYDVAIDIIKNSYQKNNPGEKNKLLFQDCYVGYKLYNITSKYMKELKQNEIIESDGCKYKLLYMYVLLKNHTFSLSFDNEHIYVHNYDSYEYDTHNIYDVDELYEKYMIDYYSENFENVLIYVPIE